MQIDSDALYKYIENPPALLEACCKEDIQDYELFKYYALTMIQSYIASGIIEEYQADDELMEYMASQPSKPHLLVLQGGIANG